MKENERKFRTYTAEFKAQALELARELGSVRKAALQLGMSSNTLHGWNYKRLAGLGGSVSPATSQGAPSAVNSTEEVELENRRLRKELEHLKKVNYILKQAAAFFSQDHLK